jgi:hypothetical protein
MSRGPLPVIGLDAALPFAKARGLVTLFRRSPGNTGHMIIAGNGCLAIVTLQKAQRLHETLADVEREYREALARIRRVPGGGPVSRELWLYSRYGVLRFFRVEDAGIVELCSDGKILPASSPGLAAPPVSPGGTPGIRDPPQANGCGGEEK